MVGRSLINILAYSPNRVDAKGQMVRRVPWNTDDIDHRWRIVDSSNDDVKNALAFLKY